MNNDSVQATLTLDHHVHCPPVWLYSLTLHNARCHSFSLHHLCKHSRRGQRSFPFRCGSDVEQTWRRTTCSVGASGALRQWAMRPESGEDIRLCCRRGWVLNAGAGPGSDRDEDEHYGPHGHRIELRSDVHNTTGLNQCIFFVWTHRRNL